MASHYQFTQQYDSDDEDEDRKQFYLGKDITIYVLDAQKSMFYKVAEGESAFDISLTTIEKTLLYKIRKNSPEQIAVVFYNTENSPDPKSDVQIACPSQCAILYVLQPIESDIIRYLKNMKASGDHHDFAAKYGHTSNTPISDVLWLCHALTANSGMQIRNTSIVWFTNNDKPHSKDSTEFNDALQKTKDLRSLFLDFQIVPLKENFESGFFYKEFVSQIMQKDRNEIDFPAPNFDSEELYKRLLTRGFRNRAMIYLNVEIMDKPQFSVGIYSFVSKKSEPRPEKVSRVCKEIVRVKRSYKYGEANEDIDGSVNYSEKLSAEKMAKTLEVKDATVKFTPLEIYEMKQIMLPSIKILGFKPLESYSEHRHKRSPYFIYPHDHRIKQSSKTFRALWETCLSMNKFIFCVVVLRLKSFPQYAALIPQREEVNTNRYDGFRMEFLPFKAEIRDLSQHIPKKNDVSEEAIKELSTAISKISINFDVEIFRNPAITKIYDKIERIEFGEASDEVEDCEFETKPKVEIQNQRMRPYIEKLKEIFDGFDTAGGTKRKATDGGEPSAKKLDINFDEGKLVEFCKTGNVKNITVSILREYLKSKNVSGVSTMKKDELVVKVVEIN